MDNDYLLTLSGHNVYREVELSSDIDLVRAGTTQRCDVRFRKEAFFDSFELRFAKEDEQWSVTCSDEVYLSIDGVRKLAYHQLEHGDEITVKYSNSDVKLFVLHFAIDFDREMGTYDREIDLTDVQALSIGGMANCNICLRSRFIKDDLITMERSGEGFILAEQTSKYGAFCNGVRVSKPLRLADKSFISIANFHFYYSAGKLYCSKTDDIAFDGVQYVDAKPRQKYSEYPKFNRNTRVKSTMDTDKIPILDPPTKPEKPKQNIIVQLLPAIGMLAVVIIMRGVMSTTSGSFVYYSIAMMSVGLFASVVGIINNKHQFKKDIVERKEKYLDYIAGKEKEVEEKREEELVALNHMYPSLDEIVERVDVFSADLFDRRPKDDDFLHVRLGTGIVESAKQLDYKENETYDVDELSDIPEKTYEKYRFIDDAPSAVNLVEAGALGVVGPESKTYGIMKDMVVDICARQYQNDVALFFIVEEENEELIHWARNIPHVQNPLLGMHNIVCNEESRNLIFEYLFKELSYRASEEGKGEHQQIVLFVIDECGLKNHPLSRFIDDAAKLNVTFIFFEQVKEHLPMGCTTIVTLERKDNKGTIIEAENNKLMRTFEYGIIDDERASQVAEILAPVYCEEISLEGALTQSITLFEMLDIIATDDLDLGERWSKSVVYKSMAAPLGVSKSHTVYLDLSDKAHGPHGLVAGTTGSGKSEILQTYILSMATLFHPYEVGFMIIDFKGGGMVNQFADLPHLMGAITNIDGREIDRSLKSIKAELQKRQRYFADADVNHINNYIKKYKAGEVANPLPHLIIVVDEFAELKAEQPEFMKELISAARIGRSLGVHLILATQKPAGQVSEQIWSNSRFKLCLKVATKEDSNEMLKSPLAAEIKEPGRAYLQVGNNEIFELFQSAYSGAPEHADDEAVKEFAIYQLDNAGKRTPIYAQKKPKSEELSATQLDAVVKHVAMHCQANGIPALPSICLPSLADVVDFPTSFALRDGMFPLGIYDDPDSQYQGEALFDLSAANTFVVGSSQMGKTNLLQTIVRSVATSYSPSEASIYIMDFASMILKNFEDLHHVGGVVVPGEDEKLKNLLKMLGEEIGARKKKLLSVGVSSFAAYKDAGYGDLPRIYLLMDNFAVFKELYAEHFEDVFLSLCREGVTYGITVVVCNSATTGFGYKYMSNFSNHIALTCNDNAEYGVVFDRCRVEPKNVPGRALCMIDKNIYEMQTYLGFEGEKEIDRVRNMRTFVDESNERYPDAKARRIPSVPDDLDLDYIASNYGFEPTELRMALNYATVDPIRIDLAKQFALPLVGKDEKTKLAFVNTLLTEARTNIFDRSVEAYIVDGVSRELSAWKDEPWVVGYYSDYSEVDMVLETVNGKLQARYDKVKDEGVTSIENDPLIIVVVHSPEAIGHISEVKDSVDLYTQMAKQYAAMRALFVFSGLVDTAVPFSGAALQKLLKDNKRGFIFSNIADHNFFDIPPMQARIFKTPLEEGQAYYIDGSDFSKVRIAVAQ